ncbi:hypothetical protein GI374_09800 [Paracoccus sp. S-4012]|uniref:BLUF domain-containing protein n=1 Tax=Paracoccus sp. S-4012 TaxID=2665648 RepID=UPI0012AFFB97|nr:BLUF domain-containing protein [Paracoccus sp. S-4012]MRX50733.1 hypothetical protein [Paracoccus sp. S-4012]
METGCFLYRSTARLGSDRDLRAILAEARDRNTRLDLTGYLHCEDGSFYQWLEGPPEPLAEVATMIERDRRHQDMRYLLRGTQAVRQFKDWRMGFGVSDPGTLFEWIAERGISRLDEARLARSILGFLLSEPVRGRAEIS